MGTDIHLYVEKKDSSGKWHRVNPPAEYAGRDPYIVEKYNSNNEKDWQEYYERKYHEDWFSMRDYDCFVILAGVRMDRIISENFKPISKPKRLPKDLSKELSKAEFGYHDKSWLTVKELIDYDWDQTIWKDGYVNFEVFKQRIESNDESTVDSYCGGAYGDNIICYDYDEAMILYERDEFPKGKSIYVKIQWKTTPTKMAAWFKNKVMPELVSLAENDFESVRIVFGFDS